MHFWPRPSGSERPRGLHFLGTWRERFERWRAAGGGGAGAICEEGMSASSSNLSGRG